MNNELLTSIEILVIYVLIRHLRAISMNYWQPAIIALRATYLPAYKAADIYVPIRHRSTFVERPLQINLSLFKTKPIYQIPKMNVSIVKTRDYKNDYDFRPGKTNPNKAKTNPISKAKKKKTLPLRHRGTMKKRIKNVEFTQYENIEQAVDKH